MSSYDHDDARFARMYDRISDQQFEGGQRLVDRLCIGAGERVLDLGCGTGRLARYIAERVGERGRVIGVDPLRERIAVAREHAPQLRFEVAGAEDLGAFEDGSFDCVCANAVFHWIEDKPKALAEVRRVLRVGGRVGCTTQPKELLLRGTVAGAVVALLAQPPYLEQLQLSGVEVMSRQLTTTEIVTQVAEQGLDLVELHVVRVVRSFEHGQDIVDFAEASSFGNFIHMVSEPLQASFRADLANALERLRGPNGIDANQYLILFVAERSAAPPRATSSS